MDFIARAGAVVDRAHRTAGVLLILVVVLTAVVITQWLKNAELNKQITMFATRMPVYVVPGSTRGIYSPTEDDLLIRAFVDQITQSFNTFTYENLSGQYNEMRSFFTPEMLTFSQTYFEKLIKDSQADRRSSLFIPDHQTLKVEKTMENGREIRNVTLRGSLQTILAGSVVESVPVETNLKLGKVVISKANPFGFLLASYQAKRINGAEQAQNSNPRGGF
ncbi:MAG: hypothetical protein COY40_04155 [Alphaproteobacteria bacterium CG_4_10_14_0_8_um_filter_53_9]|nr:MAG: hypothetical protein COY40_04155 [Alphaproteobacteria bacterium CG_4_10_14_0_8_um_filter_53_9]